MIGATATRLAELLAWRPGTYLRASGVLFTWLSIRALAQTALFILVARTLGADGYGSLIAVMAVATFFAPLAGLGGQALLVRDGARNPRNLTIHLGEALRLWMITVAPLSLVAFLTSLLLVPTALPAHAVAAIVLADLAGASLLDVLARAWQALGRMGGFGVAMAGLILARLVTFSALLAFHRPTPAGWAVWYAAVTTAYVLATFTAAIRDLGWPARSRTPFYNLAAAGFPFAFAGAAMRVQAEANKPILARFEGLSGAGAFGAAQRLIDMLLLPLQALLETLLPHAYRASEPLRAAFRLGIFPFGIAAIGGIAVALGAQALPWLLGPGFEDSVAAARWLAALPVFFVARSVLTVAIAAANGERHFPFVYGTAAMTGVVAAWYLVPRQGLAGAAAAMYASEAATILIQSILLWRKRW